MGGTQSDWCLLSQRTARLGGCIVAEFFCRGCAAKFDYVSDASDTLKDKCVGSSMVAGISQGKYKRYGTALGMNIILL